MYERYEMLAKFGYFNLYGVCPYNKEYAYE
jgi:hypothetical protein